MKTPPASRLALVMTLATAPIAATLCHAAPAPTLGDDVAFLRQHTSPMVLSNSAGARVVVVPAWQGRVMTSGAAGETGPSHGWLNRELIASGKLQPHINVFGGEDRFWLGPEGGQFSIFFAPNTPFDLEHWQTPAALDTEAFKVVEQLPDRITCRREFSLTNYSGTHFRVAVKRVVQLVDPAANLQALGAPMVQDLKAVCYESVNTIQNAGTQAWQKDSGLLSMWILGMFNASPATTVVVPFRTGPESALGPIVNDSYFGKVPGNRLVVAADKGVLFFKADANHRSKIGIPPRRARPILGSYNPAGNLLTLVDYSLPQGATDYVNSMWEIQKQPFAGDVVNSYNDGPSEPGKPQLGRFYELETSSPALALAPRATATHIHRTTHLQGPREQLDPIARALLGVGLNDISQALKP